jgi:hypothetical protein
MIENVQMKDAERNERVTRIRYELVTVLIRQQDYEQLKRLGGPGSDQIAMALQHYLRLVKEGAARPVRGDLIISLGPVTTWSGPVSRSLWKEIRELEGLTDLHTAEAVRVFLL